MLSEGCEVDDSTEALEKITSLQGFMKIPRKQDVCMSSFFWVVSKIVWKRIGHNLLISLILIPQFCYVVDIFCMDWWILFILQLFYELFHDVEKFIDFFEIRNCVFPVMKNCSSKSILFHTHTHTNSPWCSGLRSIPIVCDHNWTCFSNFYTHL